MTAGVPEGSTSLPRVTTAPPRVKVCGHTRAEDVRASVRAGVDAVGIVTDVPVDTPREVSVGRAVALVDAVPPFVTGVLVTMPETPERAVELVERIAPDAVQVHGGLPPEDIASVSTAVSSDVIAAVDADEPGQIADCAGVADALLVDSADDRGGGGTGRTHDWERTREATADLDAPVILAGGLTPENVAEAVATVDPFGVDVASGVERDGGIKDADAVAAFVRAVREVVA